MFDLKSILARRQLSISALSGKTDIDQKRLLQIFEGREPSLAELRKIATALDLPLSSLGGRNEKEDVANFMFRRTASAQNQVNLDFVEKISHTIGSTFDLLQPSKHPVWEQYFSVAEETYESAERCAEEFRSIFFDGDFVSPLHQLPFIAVEKMGVLLFLTDERNVEGASCVIDGQPFIFVSRRFPPRMLFTLAHELGHLIAHTSDEGGYAVMDMQTEDWGLKPDKKFPERFADAFASILLLPSAGVGIALKKIREVANVRSDQIGDVEILYLSRIFGTSFQVAARRCEDLDLLPRGGAASLYESLKREYGSPEKRASEINLPPRPEIQFPLISPRLLASTIEKIRAGDVSLGRAAAILGISISDLVIANAPRPH